MNTVRFAIALVFFLSALGGPAARAADAPVPVVTTLPVLADLVRQVGGPHVRVRSIITGLESEHTYTPRPGDILAVQQARLLIQIGLGLDVWVNALTQNAGRADLLRVTTSEGISLIDDSSKPAHDPHPGASAAQVQRGNVHIWLDPENAKEMVRHITNALVQVDPDHAENYLGRQAEYVRALSRMADEIKQDVAPLRDRKIVTHHPAWPYFARRFGFDIRGHLTGPSGGEPSPKQLGLLISKMKKEKIRVIVSEPQLDTRLPEMLAEETGARIVTLSALTGAIAGVDTYLDLIRHNARVLIAALQTQ